MARVGIIGMGYVGKGMLKLFQRAHDVTWYDVETQPERDMVLGVDLAVICVPTPMQPDGSCDTSIVEEVASWVDAPLVLIKSTVPPGTTDRLNQNDKKPGAWARFHFSPEYMGEPRNYVPEWKYPDPRLPHKHDFVIVGGMQAERVLDLIVPCMGPHTRFISTDTRSAELTKYMENAYFAMKVSFVTEFRNLARLLDVDWYTLRSQWLLDSRVEPDHTMSFANDPGWGGKCLPKDVNAICHAAREAGGSSPLLEAVIAVNNIHRAPAPRPEDNASQDMQSPPSEDCQREVPEGLEYSVSLHDTRSPSVVNFSVEQYRAKIKSIDPNATFTGAQVQEIVAGLEKLNGASP